MSLETSPRLILDFTIICIKSPSEGIKFRGYLISQLEKNYVLRVFNFAIWRLLNISQVFNFAISVKIRNESFIEYQFFYC